jgi:hypothetical protein
MTQLLTAIFASLPGPFMMFIGGEEGIEELLPKLSKLKESRAYQHGEVHWWVEESVDQDLFGISYFDSNGGISVLVNTSPNEISGTLPINTKVLGVEQLVGNVEIKGNDFSLEAYAAVVINHKVGQ